MRVSDKTPDISPGSVKMTTKHYGYASVRLTAVTIYYQVLHNREDPFVISAGRSGSSEVPRNPLTRWDVSNGIFLTKKKLKNKIKMPNGWRTIKSLVHKIRLHGRRGKGIMVESFSREKLRHAPQKEGG